jgi:hypothetical protein
LSSEYARVKQAEWSELVRLVLSTPENRLEGTIVEVAKEANTSVPALRNKAYAILAAHIAGSSWQQILDSGQSTILRWYGNRNRSGAEKRKRLSWMVSASLADSIQSDSPSPDQEEPLVTRLHRLGLRTSDDLWEFLHSWFALESDEALEHHIGEFVPKRFKKVGAKRR